MNLEKEMEIILFHGKNGDKEILDKLSLRSKEELVSIPDDEVISSIKSFFENKLLAVGYKLEKGNSIVFHLVDSETPTVSHRVELVKENDEHKLYWNRKSYEENK